MLFNSFNFVIFFIVVTSVYYALPQKARWVHLLLASCYFYMTFVPVYILVLFATIIVDYFAGIWIEKLDDDERKQKRMLVGSILFNVIFLLFFKYYNFFIENANYLGADLPFLKIILPIGLSFHTFQAMAYLLEIYRGNQKAERHFGIFSLYVMFYPQLVAGPIERPQNVLPQFRIHHRFNAETFFDGLRLMLWGFFKKVVVADRISIYVDAIHNHPGQYPHWLNVALAFFFFSIQVYCDFSGYSDIALGAAKTLGYDLMINFNRPYHSKSISEFWRRWHISLSTWFNDYLFTPLAGSMRRRARTGVILAVFVTFATSGFWHGAAWTFVAFGVLMSFALIYEMLTRNRRLKLLRRLPARVSNTVTFLLTFSFVMLVVVLFRANSFASAFELYKNFFTFNKSVPFQQMVANGDNEFGITSFGISIVVIALVFLVERFTTPWLREFKSRPLLDIIFCSVILILILFLGVFQQSSFIYFQF